MDLFPKNIISINGMHMEHVLIPVKKDRTHFNEKLIAAVERRPPIWDMDNTEHRNSKKVMILWKEVANVMKSTVKVVMHRWRNLRDTYKKYTRQITAGVKNGSNTSVSWVHFEQLQFINKSVAAGQPREDDVQNVHSESDFMVATEMAADDGWDTKNYASSLDIGAPQEGQSSSEDAARFLQDTSPVNSTAPEMSPHVRLITEPPICTLSTSSVADQPQPARDNPPRKRRYNHSAHKYLAIENDGSLGESTTNNLRFLDNQFQAIMQSSMDPIDHFLLSLAPHVRETPPELLPSLKMNLMYIVCKYGKGVIPTELLQIDV